MNAVVVLLVFLALSRPAFASEAEAPVCEESACPIPQKADPKPEVAPSKATLRPSTTATASALLDRGDAAGAARLLADEAERDPDAACLLGRALRELGDEEGAAAAERKSGPTPCALRR